jgi:hypothetical protein
VGVISACNYPSFRQEGTPLRKLSGANLGFLVNRNQIFPREKVFVVFFLNLEGLKDLQGLVSHFPENLSPIEISPQKKCHQK